MAVQQGMGLKGRDFLTIHSWQRHELQYLLDLALELKGGQSPFGRDPLRGRSIGLIFTKSSTRTRVSFEVAMFQSGGQALFLSPSDIQVGRGESIADTARVLSRYLDALVIRTYAQAQVEEMAENATIPIINGLTDREHPCQVMADLLTVVERKGRLDGLRLAYVGDGNNMAHSLMHAGVKFGMTVAVATPRGYEPAPAVVAEALAAAGECGGRLVLTHDPAEAVAGADVVYTDVWASMGQEAEQAERQSAFANFQVNEALLSGTAADAIFLHCLPAHRGEEVSAGVIDGPKSAVWDQAENRLHAQKAILQALILGGVPGGAQR